jgi:beta-lactamase regulating signal transducer with metallopeptidase domain
MHGVVDALNRFGAEWTMLVVAQFWQSTLVALLVAAAAWALARSSPAVRYWLWQIVAIKLLVLPLWSWSLALPWLPADGIELQQTTTTSDRLAVAAANEAILAAPTAVPGATLVDRPRWPLADVTSRGWLFATWAAIVLLQVGRLGVQRIRLSRLLAKVQPCDEGLVAMVRQVAARLQLKRAPKVVLTDLDCSPFVCGMGRGILVLPRELLAVLAPQELLEVIAHELSHLKRRDLVWGWIPEIARMLFFFHPVAHWASYRIRLERELACDQVAITHSGRSAAQYVETLVRVLGSASCRGILPSAAAASLCDGGPREGRSR